MKRFLATVALINLSIFSIAQKNPLPPGNGYVVYYNQAESLYGKAKRLSGVEDEDGRGRDVRQRCGQQAQAVVECGAFEDGHQAASLSFHSGGSSTERASS